MREYPTHTWEDALTAFRARAESNPAFAPMRDAVERLAASPYAAGLHPVLSMHTLRLYQHEHAGSEDEEVRLDYEDGAFVVRHRAGTTSDPRSALSRYLGSGPSAVRTRWPCLGAHSTISDGSSSTKRRVRQSASRRCCVTFVEADERSEHPVVHRHQLS
jgi:hypothetical protein